MNLSQITEWILFNKVEIGVVIALAIFLAYKYIKKKKEKYEEALDMPPEKPPEEPSIDTESLYLEEDFEDVNMMETSNLEKLKEFRNFIIEDIKARQKDYKKAKKKYIEVLEIEKRLRIHIPVLLQQKEMINRQIKSLEKK